MAAKNQKTPVRRRKSPPSVVFVTAHPDDVAFSMGGTAWLLKDRYQLHVICASQGERGYQWDGPGPNPPRADLAAIRAKEEAKACKLLGAGLDFLGQIDGEIYADRPACEKTARLLAKLKPAALFTNGPMEKPDHAASYMIALKALNLANLFWTTEMYMPLRHSETRNAKYADIYVNISAVIEHKKELIRCHQTQLGADQTGDGIILRNELLGRLAWCDYAEAYQTGLPLMATRWNRPAGSILMDLT